MSRHFKYVKPEGQSSHFEKEYEDIWKIMQAYVFKKNAKKLVEFGTRSGDSTRIFCEALLKTHGSMISFDTVDPGFKPGWMDKYDHVYKFVKGKVEELKLEMHDVDIWYIDDYHEYDHILDELKKHEHIMKPDGLILFHDITKPIPTNAKHGNSNKESSQILQAVREYAIRFHPQATLTLHYGQCGLGALQL